MVRLLFAGDVMLGRTFNTVLSADPQYNVWGNTRDLLHEADLVCINLETTLTDYDVAWPNKAFNFRLSPRYARVLNNGHVDFCCLANNHILDYLTPGMLDTQNTLRQLNIASAGVGLNVHEARQATILEVEGTRVAFVCASDHPSNWQSNATTRGIHYVSLDHETGWPALLQHVTEVRTRCDLLVFSIHYGANWVEEGRVDPRARTLFHRLIDHGVHLVHGHSAHHVLPMERYGHGWIMYGCGDFLDDYAVDGTYRNDLGCLFEFSGESATELEPVLYPTRITSKPAPHVDLIPRTDTDWRRVIESVTATEE